MEKYTYALILILSIAYPLLKSFEDKLNLFQKWKFIWPVIFGIAVPFLIWDIIFTHQNVWSFNEKFVSGLFLGGLPVEEWLFFLMVPYSCYFIYEVISYFLPVLPVWIGRYITLFLLLFLIPVWVFNLDHIYTFISIGLTLVLLGYMLWISKSINRITHFYLSNFVSLIPFLLVNGILTRLPVVIYNDAENMGLRLFTIPLEDFSYLFLMLMPLFIIVDRIKYAK